MTGKPRLLFLSHILPYPPDSGAAIRTFNVLKVLATAFDVTALCFFREDPAQRLGPEERTAALQSFAQVRAFPIRQERSRKRMLADHLRSVLTARPYTWYLYDSAEYRCALDATLRESPPSLIHVDSLDLLRYLPRLPRRIPVICTHHNVESQLLARRAGGERNPLARMYLRLQALNLARAERRWVPKMALNIAVSDADAGEFRLRVPEAAIACVPNGVDTTFFAPQVTGEDQGCVFTGGLDWWPNLDALQWFAAEVAPLLERAGQTDPVVWIGHADEDQRSRFGKRGIALTGYVDDIRPYVASASCFIVPLRIGGGTRLKILNAWAMGKAVVSTSIGAEGLLTRQGGNVLLADSPAEFARAVLSMLEDRELRERLGREGRRTVEEHYGWERLGDTLVEHYRKLLKRQRDQVVGEGRAG